MQFFFLAMVKMLDTVETRNNVNAYKGEPDITVKFLSPSNTLVHVF